MAMRFFVAGTALGAYLIQCIRRGAETSLIADAIDDDGRLPRYGRPRRILKAE